MPLSQMHLPLVSDGQLSDQLDLFKNLNKSKNIFFLKKLLILLFTK